MSDASSRDLRETPTDWARLFGDVYWDTSRSPWWVWLGIGAVAFVGYDFALFLAAALVAFAIRTSAGGSE